MRICGGRCFRRADFFDDELMALVDGPGGYVDGGFEAVVLAHLAAVGVLVVEPGVDDAHDSALADVGDGDHDVAVAGDEGFGGAGGGDGARVLHVGGEAAFGQV